MTERDKLFVLIYRLLNDSYDIMRFCSEFVRTFDYEIDDYEEMTNDEIHAFGELCELSWQYKKCEDESLKNQIIEMAAGIW